MAIRITGMNSGLDTESIITALTQRYQDKVDTHKNNQKKLTWKQEKWKALNKKVTSFYNGTLANMRFSTAYTQKTTSASNSNAVTVITGEDAMIANQTLSIKSLATSAFLTGDKVKTTGNASATKSTTMSELGITEDGQTLSFKIGSDDSDLLSVTVNSTDTVGAVLTKLRSATSSVTGTSLNFNYDETNGRFFVSSKNSGAASNFEAVSSDLTSKLGLESANYVNGEDAEIELNGVTYKGTSNTFSINGLTITAKEKAENITLSTTQDTSGINNNIKKLLTEYNEMMKEFATAYNADKATKYKMLTDDQKENMSEDEIKEWEDKIKTGLLSGDETISNIRDGLKSVVNAGYSITLADGTTATYYLSNFGISTGSYFATEENDRDALHIDGDSEDAVTSGNADVLKALIASDPEAVQNFFTQFSRSVYGKLSDLMRGTEYSSSFTIYEDKLMASQYSSYTTKISDAEEALTAAQDKYYSKFSAMETALAKINSSSSSLAGMLGTSR
jgi:flagellar hook-associated protein 2